MLHKGIYDIYITFRATSAIEIQTYARATHGFASSEAYTCTTYEACTAAIGSTRASLTTFRSCAMRRVASVARATATTRRSATHRQANPWCMAVSMLLACVDQSTSHDLSSYCARCCDRSGCKCHDEVVPKQRRSGGSSPKSLGHCSSSGCQVAVRSFSSSFALHGCSPDDLTRPLPCAESGPEHAQGSDACS